MTVLERVPVERISAEAQQIRVGRALVSVMVAPLYLLGWLVFWLLVGLLTVVKFASAGVKLGFLDAREAAVARGVTIPGRLAGRAEDRRGVGTR